MTPKPRVRKEAYKLILAELKNGTRCQDKDYCIGCYGCGLRLVYKTLKSHYDWDFNTRSIKKK